MLGSEKHLSREINLKQQLHSVEKYIETMKVAF